MQWIVENKDLILICLFLVWILVQVVVKLTPTKKDDEVLNKLLPLVDTLSKVDLEKVSEILDRLNKDKK